MLTKQDIVTMLENDKRAVARAIVVLTARQTADEQASKQTRHHNGRGFRPCHATMGTSMATFFLRTGYLTDAQIAYWRKRDKSGAMRIGIYAGQLLEEAHEKAIRNKAFPKSNVNAVPFKIHDFGARGTASEAEANAISKFRLTESEEKERQRLEYEIGMVMDSDDEQMVDAAQKDLDDFVAKMRNKV